VLRRVVRLLLLGLATAASPAIADWKVLVFSRTEGYRHASIDAGLALLEALGDLEGFALTATEDPAVFTRAGLSSFRAVVFLNTTGDVLDPPHEAALRCFVESGGGWIGVHSAADTESGWSWYGTLLGGDAWFLSHPAIQAATLVRESASHPATAHYLSTIPFTDEWYNFAANPRPAVEVLLRIDEESYEPGTGAMGGDHPIAWSHPVGGGRAFYTNLGHRSETYSVGDFGAHLLGGLEWAARCATESCAGDLLFRDGFESGNACRWTSP
jgi:type 1 glutamine amidotransferase